MVADAIYLFPEASKRIAAIGNTAQSKLDWIPVADPSYKDKTILKSDAGPEQIAAVKPDAVILKTTSAETLGKPLEILGIPVVYVDFETPEQYQRDLKTLGLLFGNTARAEQLATFFQSHANKVTQVTTKLEDAKKPNVLLMYYTERDGAVAFSAPPLSWMQTMLVQMAGGRLAWKDAQLGSGWTKVNLEQIAAWDADQIYIIAYFNNPNDVTKALKADPQWQKMRAVKEGKLYAFPGDYYSWDQLDTRWILGLTWLAGKVHPDLFPNLDIQQETRTFYRELYSLDDAMYSAVDLPAFVRRIEQVTRRMCFMVIRAPSADGVMAEVARRVWGHPYDSPNFQIAYNVLLQMGIRANVRFEESPGWAPLTSATLDEALNDVKRRMMLNTAEHDLFLMDLLQRQLHQEDGQFVWPRAVRSALVYWQSGER